VAVLKSDGEMEDTREVEAEEEVVHLEAAEVDMTDLTETEETEGAVVVAGTMTKSELHERKENSGTHPTIHHLLPSSETLLLM